MSMTDPIADMLARMRNAALIKRRDVTMPSSKLKVEIAKILKEEGFIKTYKVAEDGKRVLLTLTLKYTEARTGWASPSSRPRRAWPRAGSARSWDSAARSSATSGDVRRREVRTMSRVGKRPIVMPDGVTVQIAPDTLEFSGKKGKLTTPLLAGITARTEGNQLLLSRADDTKVQKALHGLCRALAANAATGVSKGFQKQLEIVGVGYKAKIEKSKL
jgi:Ribosomal protein S8/Ribosomal protein L6